MKLPLTNEIVACLISSSIKLDTMNVMRNNPKDFLQKLLKSELSEELKVQMVENTKDDMHLGLPYYAKVDEFKHLRNSYLFKIANNLKNFFAIMKVRKYA